MAPVKGSFDFPVGAIAVAVKLCHARGTVCRIVGKKLSISLGGLKRTFGVVFSNYPNLQMV